jgi:CRISPR-associated protein Cas2
VKKAKDSGAVIQIWTDQNPQGFSYRQFGERDRRFIDLDGLALVEFKRAQETEKG